MTQTDLFIAELQPHQNFEDVFNLDLYTALPADWLIVATDVQGSTRAIEAGRYKEVNTLGATTIISAINACRPHVICFQFGGDGALLAVPPSCLENVQLALSQLMEISQSQFQLKLRVAIWSVSEFKKMGFEFDVLKFAVAPQQFVYMFAGSGVEASDLWLKQNQGGQDLFREIKAPPSSEFTQGLECRWNPIESKIGLICTGLVKTTRPENARSIFKQIHQVIDVKQFPETVPTRWQALPVRWPPRHLLIEWKARTFGQSWAQRARYLFSATLKTLLLTPLVGLFKEKIPYLKDLGARSDYQKFDGMFRFVRDLSQKQYDELAALCERLHREGEIYYGLHQSPSALMTCMVFTGEDHLHFVDGSQGGYALAAKQLKEQLKRQRSDSSPNRS